MPKKFPSLRHIHGYGLRNIDTEEALRKLKSNLRGEKKNLKAYKRARMIESLLHSRHVSKTSEIYSRSNSLAGVGSSRRVIYKWLQRLISADFDIEALSDKLPRRRHPSTKTDSVRSQVRALRKHGHSIRAIQVQLKKRGESVSIAFIHKVISSEAPGKS